MMSAMSAGSTFRYWYRYWYYYAVLLAFLVIGTHAQDFDFQKMMNQNCPNFKCSSGYTPVPKSRQKFESTGCSAMGGGAVMMNPGDSGSNEKPYEDCCHAWHACYQVCGVAKKTCDNTFEACAKEACGDDEKCTKDLELSSMMMKLTGCKPFDEAQYQACECVVNDKVPEKREAAIRNFYKKNSPENIDKAKSLVTKADTPSKLAGLFIKLLSKYPDAIIKKEDPMKSMFDKIKLDEADKVSDEDEAEKGEAADDEKIEL
mmetsp:Transcript_100135/g.289121  ORF Transcript_100135/g.289121 Transcript_100135/m.289121 type:complete len:260 (-) Transcript_100135:477-1256(-)|eukprot:CAMPEP_0176144156 /NCGR_PEP_ID=MMETSP0120_2-20121206/73390_1 /TAXON_ID=160619 /ORGANISM="Kryptoperidinium foliaceum, Strain CCMP 1326" /LENGTH=259 /DNA_ID=CAMNT_0017480513 /DNA_START=52 /DNA_END=831 /DNA_ORIENTATION=-